MSLHKTIAAIALTVAASHALADWVEIGSGQKGGANNDSSVTMYYDHSKTASIGRSRDLKRALILQTYDKKQPLDKGMTFTSMVTRMEVDCQKQKYQPVAFFFYSESMGNGTIVNSISEPSYSNKWEYPAPNSAMDTLVERACKS